MTNFNIGMTLTSREVAGMVGREHRIVGRDIRKIIDHLRGANDFVHTQYFIESTYVNEQNGQTYSQFLLTKKGCELYATRMTGQEGTLFAVQYIEKFNAMENHIATHQQDSYMIGDPVERARKWIEEEEKRLQLAATVEEQIPHVEYKQRVLDAENAFAISHIAKDYGMSPQELNNLLKRLGIQFKLKNQWLLKRAYDGYGYTKSRTYISHDGRKAIPNTQWTQKGREFIHNTLLRGGYIELQDNGTFKYLGGE